MSQPTAEQVRTLFRMHYSPEAKNERARRAAALDTTRSWVDPNGYRLSDRLWNARQDTRDAIDEIIRRAIADGSDALQVAKTLEAYLLPEARPLRDLATGRLIRNQPKQIVTAFPDARKVLAGRSPSKGSYPARRLMRTEISRAHGQAVMWAGERNPLSRGTGWSLSAAHPKRDQCDINATQDLYGLGPGVYPHRSLPRYPDHPHDLCFLSSVSERDPIMRRANIDALRTQFGLDISEPGKIPDPGFLTEVRALGGSTGATLQLDPRTGFQYVVKKGTSPDHLISEHLADRLYEAIGLNVPKSELFGVASGSPTKVAQFIDGTPLNQLSGAAREAAEAELRRTFVNDALLGNWDVVGLDADNILVTAKGTVYRIDNGGALGFRAQGARKTATQWNEQVDELVTMRTRDNAAGRIFRDVSDADIAEQIEALLPKRAEILKAAREIDPDVARVLAARIENLDDYLLEFRRDVQEFIHFAPDPNLRIADQVKAFGDEQRRMMQRFRAPSLGELPEYVRVPTVANVEAMIEKVGKVTRALDEMEFAYVSPSQTLSKQISELRTLHKRILADLQPLGVDADIAEITKLFKAREGPLRREYDRLRRMQKAQAKVPKATLNGTSQLPSKYDITKTGEWSDKWDRAGFKAGRGRDQSRRWESQVNLEQLSSVRDYTGGTHKNLNKYLRGGRTDVPGWETKSQLEDYATNISKAFKHSEARVREEMVVHRGTRIRDNHPWWNADVGDVITDEGFMSTSIKPDVAKSFRGNAKIVAWVPENARGLWLETVSNFAGEEEVLWDIGQTWRVLRKEVSTGPGGEQRLQLVLEYVEKKKK